ncbi:MAG: hypothetical protein K2Y56_02310 [Methylobacterium sp.]|uniref:hypothetical protein n=1 Tax=Methylobacterium sp. TaxID=409 RepID=UPI0025EB06C0|nr:hypothetical protein [Methylobacterium sp.]MBX9930364.1 hypothetical protein [Methylobacterium sp.]
MLLDWLSYLTTPAPWDARRLGFVRDSIWLQSRSRRCRKAWKPHLDRSRALIAGAVAEIGRGRTAVVLGSGLLDDIPLDRLADSFNSVVLVDMVHPWPARLAARRHPHVGLLTFDLSGCADWMLGRRTEPGLTLPAVCLGGDVDLVVSANVLSQLPILPLDHFCEGEDIMPDLGSRIVSAHLDALAQIGCRICLVTDTVQREEDRSGQVLDRSDLLHGVDAGSPDQEWDWVLAPFGEAARGSRLVHRVHGFSDWRPSR